MPLLSARAFGAGHGCWLAGLILEIGDPIERGTKFARLASRLATFATSASRSRSETMRSDREFIAAHLERAARS
jgi:hypothetical protein